MLWIALSDPRLYYAANILNIVGNVCYGSAFVFYTSYIPKLARNYPEVLNASSVSEKLDKLTFRTSRISIFGSAAGFFGGFLQMLVAVGMYIYALEHHTSYSLTNEMIGILFAMNETLLSMRVATMVGGLWWAVFAIPAIFLLKRRPGPPLPKGENYIFYSWKKSKPALCCQNDTLMAQISKLYISIPKIQICSTLISTLFIPVILFLCF